MSKTSTEAAYDEGMQAASYSLGVTNCKYEFGTKEYQAFLNGYRYQYKRG